MTDTSDSEDDNIPLSEMVRKSKQNKADPPPIIQQKKKHASSNIISHGSSSCSRRSRRLLRRQRRRQEEEPTMKKIPVKKAKASPAKKQSKPKSKAILAIDVVGSPRKTRAMRKRAAQEASTVVAAAAAAAAAKQQQEEESASENAEENSSKNEESSSSNDREPEQSEIEINEEEKSDVEEEKSNDKQVDEKDEDDVPMAAKPSKKEDAKQSESVSRIDDEKASKGQEEAKVDTTTAVKDVEESAKQEPEKKKNEDEPIHALKEEVLTKSEDLSSQQNEQVQEKESTDATTVVEHEKDVGPSKQNYTSNDNKQTEEATTDDPKKPFDVTAGDSKPETVPKGNRDETAYASQTDNVGPLSTAEPMGTEETSMAVERIEEPTTIIDSKLSTEQEAAPKTDKQGESHQDVGNGDTSQMRKFHEIASERDQVMFEYGVGLVPQAGKEDTTKEPLSTSGTSVEGVENAALVDEPQSTTEEQTVSQVDETKAKESADPPKDSTVATNESALDLLAKLADTEAAPQSQEEMVTADAPDPSPLEFLANVAGGDGAESKATESKDKKDVDPVENTATASQKSDDATEFVQDDGGQVLPDQPEDSKEVAPKKSSRNEDERKTISLASQSPIETTKVADKDADISMTDLKAAASAQDSMTAVVTGKQEQHGNQEQVGDSNSAMDVDEKDESFEQLDSQVKPMVMTEGAEGKSTAQAADDSNSAQNESSRPQDKPPTEAVAKTTDNIVETNELIAVSMADPTKSAAVGDNVKNDQAVPEDHTPTVPLEPKLSPSTTLKSPTATEMVDAVLDGANVTAPAAAPVDARTLSPKVVTKEIPADSTTFKEEGTPLDSLQTTGAASQKLTSSDDHVTVHRRTVAGESATRVNDKGEKEGDGNETVASALRVPAAKKSKDVTVAVSEATNKLGEASSGEKETTPVPMEVDATGDIKQEPQARAAETLKIGDRPTEVKAVPNTADKVGKADMPVPEQQQAQVSLDRDERSRPVEESCSAKKIPTRANFKPPTAEDTAALLDVFPDMAKRTKRPESRPRKRRRKYFSIRISSVPTSLEKEKNDPNSSSAAKVNDEASGPFHRDLLEIPDMLAFSETFASEWANEDGTSLQDNRDFEESLAFFSETHEDQDPAFIEFQQIKESNRLKNELANLKKTYEVGVAKINTIIASQLKEKQAQTDMNIEKLRNKQTSEEQKDLQRLQEAYGQKMKSNNNKINEGIKVMTSRHNDQMQKAHLEHRQQAQQRGVPEQMIANEWGPLAQRLQAKQQQALNEFNAKGEEVKKRYEAEYQREKEKYVTHHEKRRQELENTLQKVFAKIRSQFQQQHQRYLKAHTVRLKKRREEILSLLAESEEDKRTTTADTITDKNDTKVELRSPSPVTLRFAPSDDSGVDSSGAASRSKHRKVLLSAVRKQLSVEIHNEGLWISIIMEKDDEAKKHADSNDGKNNEFLPWGVKARGVLQSIISGEIPLGYGTDRFDFGDAIAVQGGHIRCVVVDLRTSEETASAQRAAGMKAQEADSLKALQEKVDQLSRQVAEADAHNAKAATEEKEMNALYEKAVKDLERAKGMVQQLRTKFKNLLGPDDVPLPTLKESDRQKLTSAMSKYAANVEAHQARLQAVEKAAYEKKVKTQKTMTMVRQANKAATSAASTLKKKKAQLTETKPSRSRGRLSETMEADRASTRVADVINGLEKAAEGRREQLNLKRSSAASSTYIQSLPGLPNGLKKSLWHKMHRRRQQIVLRPSMEFVLKDVKETAEEAEFYAKDRSSARRSKEEIGVRAEQLFLLSAFPEQGMNALPSTPPLDSHDSWAEPGWHVNLEVPIEEINGSRSLLPRVRVPSIMQNSHSELCSAPGRQVASLITTTHLQALNTPLSAAAQAISLAETSPVAKDFKLSEYDPFNTTEAVMKAGYTFALRSPSKSSSSQSRRKTTPLKASTPSPSPVATPSPRKLAISKPTSVEVPVPQPPPSPSPLKRSTSAASRKPASKPATKTEKPAKPKRSRSKSSTAGSSPRTKASKMTADATAAASAAAADAASQARKYAMQQQAAANALYGQQQMEQQAAQYSPSYMKQVAATQANLQGLQPPQLQPAMAAAAAQQQLMPQPPYGSYSPQQRQFAQMRMMQQQQQGRAPGFPQQQPNMQYYPAAMQAAARQQAAYGSQQALAAAASMQQGQQQQQQHRRTASAEERNDPIFMLPDAPPPPSPPKQG